MSEQARGGHDAAVTIELRAAGARLVLDPQLGGRIHQLLVEIDGREEALLYSPGGPAAYEREPLVGGCYPMAPWPNRIRDGVFSWSGRRYRVPLDANGEALHGLVFDRPWDVVARVGRVVEMSCEFGREWPWEGKAWQRIELGPNFLALKMEVRSAREAFPAGCGWHPWFRRDVAGSPDVRVTLPAASRYVRHGAFPSGELVDVTDDFALDGRPLGERRIDDCYTGFERGSATVEWERLGLTMAFDCPMPHVQVYTPPEAFCIEPQTCAADAFNLAAAGTALVAPGRPLALSCRWTWSLR